MQAIWRRRAVCPVSVCSLLRVVSSMVVCVCADCACWCLCVLCVPGRRSALSCRPRLESKNEEKPRPLGPALTRETRQSALHRGNQLQRHSTAHPLFPLFPLSRPRPRRRVHALPSASATRRHARSAAAVAAAEPAMLRLPSAGAGGCGQHPSRMHPSPHGGRFQPGTASTGRSQGRAHAAAAACMQWPLGHARAASNTAPWSASLRCTQSALTLCADWNGVCCLCPAIAAMCVVVPPWFRPH